MSRPLRIEYPGAWYHVLNRGRRREKIFPSDSDYLLFCKILGECTKLFNIEIHAYSLIPNHYHLLLHTPKGNLSRSMRHLSGVYTQAINRKYKTEGSLFKGRFKSILIEKENYLLELVRYIHRNPYKAKLEKEIGNHKWTSHAAYMKNISRPEWLVVDDVLLEFDEHENEALRQLDLFVKKEVPKDISVTLNRIRWPAMLGGNEFKEKIKKILKGKKIDKREVPEYRVLEKGESCDKIIKSIEREVGEEGMFSRKWNKKNILKKRAIIYICRQYFNMTYGDMHGALGLLSPAALSKQFYIARKEVENKQGCYSDFKKMSEMLKLKS